jgi:choline dehydrogenase
MYYIRETATAVWHGLGTCDMLPKKEGGVVDYKLRVYEVKGLRIVDVSVFPVTPDTHTVSPTYIVAEKAVAIIKVGNDV